MRIVDQIRHHHEVVAAMQHQIAHYRNVADKAEQLIVALSNALQNPNHVGLAEIAKAEVEYYEIRRKG